MRVHVVRHLAGYALAALAVSLPWPLLMVVAWDHSGGGSRGAWALGLTGTARMVPYIALSWAVGRLGDRVRRDRLVVATLALRLACLTAVAVAVAQGRVWVAVSAACLAVACGTPAYPAIAAAMPALARSAGLDARRATDVLVTVEAGAWVVGPALGGLLLWPATRGWVPTVAALLTLASLAFVLGLELAGPGDSADRAPGPGLVASVRSQPQVLRALAVVGLVNVALSALAVILLPLSREVWGHGESGFGAATACLGFGALAAPLLGWVVADPAPRRILALLTMATSICSLGWWAGPGPALPLLAVIGACIVVVESTVTQTIQEQMHERHLAGALGIADSVMVSGAFIGTVLAPALVSSVGPRAATVVMAVGCLGTALVSGRLRNRANPGIFGGAPGRLSTPPLPRSEYEPTHPDRGRDPDPAAAA